MVDLFVAAHGGMCSVDSDAYVVAFTDMVMASNYSYNSAEYSLLTVSADYMWQLPSR